MDVCEDRFSNLCLIDVCLIRVRISGGVYPRIVEQDYYSSHGQYTVDATVSNTMKNSIMYKMCYYRFADVSPNGMDRTRQVPIGHKNFKMKYLEEGVCVCVLYCGQR